MNEQEAIKPRGADERRAVRHPLESRVRLFVLGTDGHPVAERFCAGVDVSSTGIGVRTPGTLDPGSRVIVVFTRGTEPDIWLASVVHVRVCPDGSRILGLDRLEMCETVEGSPWLRALRAAA